MEDFSDSTNRMIIIIVMFVYYLYIKYQQTQLLMMKHVQNVSCNPLEMIVGGIINPEQSNDVFSACMQYVTAENTNKSIQKTFLFEDLESLEVSFDIKLSHENNKKIQFDYKDYYDQETIEYVYNLDKFIINKYNYDF